MLQIRNKKEIFFFQNASDKIEQIRTKLPLYPIICLGDFNTVLSNENDIISGIKHSKKSVEIFNKFVSKLVLFDAWKIKNENIRAHTWSRGKPAIARRLDYIFISENMLPHLENAEIKSLSFSDHRAVIAKFKFSDFRKGPSLFKMNTSLLKDIKYVDMIKQRILETQKDISLDPHLMWENIKIEVKTVTQEYSRYKSMERGIKHDQNMKKLNQLEDNLARDPNNRNLAEQILLLKNEIEIKAIHEANGAYIRSKVKWIEEGEKCNKYFLSLEKKQML